jgi:hypothetical protein
MDCQGRKIINVQTSRRKPAGWGNRVDREEDLTVKNFQIGLCEMLRKNPRRSDLSDYQNFMTVYNKLSHSRWRFTWKK